MSGTGTVEPTISQSSINFIGIDQTTDEKPKTFTKELVKNEYVVGGTYGKDINIILNRNSDILTKTFGDGIVLQMLRDPEVKKCETVIKISVLGEGVTFFPAVPKPAVIPPPKPGVTEDAKQKQDRLTRELEIERYELAEKYAKFATRAIKNLDTSFIQTLENMLDAIVY